MRNIKNSLTLLFFVVGLSMLTGLAAMCLKWLFCGMNLQMGEAVSVYRYWSLLSAIIISSVLIIVLIYTEALNSKVRRIMSEQGVTPQLLALLKKRADTAKKASVKNHRKLILASYLTDGGYFPQCFDILREIRPETLSKRSCEEYFNIWVYAKLMEGDITAAEAIYNKYRPVFDRARLRDGNMPVLHTIGVLEYAKGNYTQAETILVQAKNSASSKQGKCECNLYLGLCYLKTGRPQYAKAAAAEAAKQASTFYQRENLVKLMKLTEKAYAVQSEELR